MDISVWHDSPTTIAIDFYLTVHNPKLVMGLTVADCKELIEKLSKAISHIESGKVLKLNPKMASPAPGGG